MKSFLIASIVLCLIGGIGYEYHRIKTETPLNSFTVAEKTPKKVNLSEVMANLRKTFPSVKETYTYSQKLNPDNKLYTSEGLSAGVSFYDTRTNDPPTQTAYTTDSGGSIEEYASDSDAIQRYSQLQSLQYSKITNPGAIKLYGTYVIRASKNYSSANQKTIIDYLYAQLQ